MYEPLDPERYADELRAVRRSYERKPHDVYQARLDNSLKEMRWALDLDQRDPRRTWMHDMFLAHAVVITETLAARAAISAVKRLGGRDKVAVVEGLEEGRNRVRSSAGA